MRIHPFDEHCPNKKFPDHMLDNNHAVHLHDQTLSTLNERGGLSMEEIVYHVHKENWGRLSKDFIASEIERLKQFVY